MAATIKLVIQGIDDDAVVPGIETLAGRAEIVCANSPEALGLALEDADVMLGWNFRANDLQAAWPNARRLRWIHWCGAGVDALLFPELVASDVTVTNARGIFDRPMAEYALGLILAMAKGFRRSFDAQAERRWDYRQAERIEGRPALVVGAGSIGRTIAGALRDAGLEVTLMGRTARDGDPAFGHVRGIDELNTELTKADFVILVPPLTDSTRGLFGREQFRAMRAGGRVINLGRGALMDESALLDALGSGTIAGAASDVFAEEPLPSDSPLWDAPNFIVSPHMSGDFIDHHAAMSAQFFDNFSAYEAGQPLRNVVDKRLGFVR